MSRLVYNLESAKIVTNFYIFLFKTGNQAAKKYQIRHFWDPAANNNKGHEFAQWVYVDPNG